MKLNGYDESVLDFEEEYGKLSFIGLRREDKENDENGEPTKVRKRVYNVLSEKQRTLLMVSVPAETPLCDFNRKQPVKLEKPVLNFMARRNYPQVEVVPYLTAQNIVAAGSAKSPQSPPDGKSKGGGNNPGGNTPG